MAATAAASSSSPAGGASSPTQAPGGGGGGGGGGVPYHRSRFGDTTLTKVFVGGLAWETPSAGLHDHFREYGEILEAVVITDRETGRSKGYGFVTFRDPESAQQAVQNPNPMIAGRRANCNIASMGPPRPSPQRGRAPRGPDQQHSGPEPYMGGRMHHQQQQMPTPPHAMFYNPSPYGYWYPPDYQYQQAFYNQMQQNYSQQYGQTSPSTSPYPYMGYMTSGQNPRAGFSPLQQQAARPPFFQQPAEGSFQAAPSLPPNFRLQLPPRAISRQSDDVSGSQPTQTVPEAEATNTDNQEASAPVERSNSEENTSN
ncbi:probable RNA-binding protein ARP1 [Triticum aestivum]|uniref:RRM domain-containing protein n=2 Tax=Triticum aestivum TaxID=4565 RepID=A0A3B6QLI1_WHEAT|nr:probable RNA-binding protein ARP1 [Triticum aestivum]